MAQISITNMNSALCKPPVGEPKKPVQVDYLVSAYTRELDDIFWSKGNIIPIKENQ